MPSPLDSVLELLDRHLTQASKERVAQAQAFDASIAGLRSELRWLVGVSVVAMAVITLAANGAFAHVTVPGLDFETRSAAPVDTTPAAVR